MKNLISLCLILSISLVPKTSLSQMSNVPLIDREIFFGNPEISGGQLSPDGQWISFMKEYNGIMNLWVKQFDEPFEDARVLTDTERPLAGYFWTYDSKYLLFVKDSGGDENYNVFAVNPQDAADAETKLPPSRNLTPKEGVRALIYNVSKKDPNVLWIGLNDRDASWHDLYKLDIVTGEMDKLLENTSRITSWIFDWDENLRLATSTDEDGNNLIYRVGEGNTFEEIYRTSVLETAYPGGWLKDNSAFYLVSNKGDANLTALYTMNPETEEITLLEKDPENRVDFGGIFLSDVSREPILTTYTDDKTRRYWKNKNWEEDYKFLQSKFPGREIGMGSSTKDEKKMLVTVYGDKYASERYYFNAENRDLVHQYTARPKLKELEEHLAPMTPIRFSSSDGMEIPAYLTLPKGAEAKDLPAIVLVHGGPWARDGWGYNSFVQFLANRGFAVIQPNFRGSSGFGKDFLNAGNLQWGLKMQDDVTWAAKYLIEEGIADPSRVAIMGGSYGGYATLAGLVYTPEMYSCGVDIVGPSNLFTLLESLPPYWAQILKMFHERMGDPNTEEGKELLTAASPLFHAEKITKPLLIIQGANDPRVKQAESDQIVVAMRELGRDVQYLLADDEGHGFAKPVNNMAMLAASEKFLAKYCGTRYQEDMPEDVAKRLEEITVDINTVTLPEKEEVTIASDIPELLSDLEEAYDYDIALAVQGQNMEMTMQRTVSKVDDEWVVTDKSSTPMGEASDENHFDATNLKPTARKVSQGGMNIDMVYNDHEATVNAMGNEVKVPFEGAYLSDGAGFDFIVARFPMVEGFETSFQILDAMTMKPKTMKLMVTGTEKIGDVDCRMAKVVNTENSNESFEFWIDPSKKMARKIVQTIPMMGNAVMTVTLKE